METEIIEKATELLQPINYNPNHIGYFVKQDGQDMGNADYCEKCIKSAVWHAQKYHREKRAEILDKYLQIKQTGYYKGVDCREYSHDAIENSKKLELEEYPAKSKFTYEGHDPDFSGGETEPLSCEKCGHYFHTNFEPNKESAEYLLEEFLDSKKLSESLKWKLDIAFYNFRHIEPAAQEILLRIANDILTPNA